MCRVSILWSKDSAATMLEAKDRARVEDRTSISMPKVLLANRARVSTKAVQGRVAAIVAMATGIRAAGARRQHTLVELPQTRPEGLQRGPHTQSSMLPLPL